MEALKGIDFFELEGALWLAQKQVHIPAYDFKFTPLFEVRRPRLTDSVTAVARVGAIADYSKSYAAFKELGFDLINSVEEHERASELAHWYPLIKDHTPKSKVYAQFPRLDVLKKDFTFPVFIKGNRQTAKHSAELSIAKNKTDFSRIQEAYKRNTILHWQKVVVRKFIPLKPLNYSAPDKVQISKEFRTFWWKGSCVGAGHYWSQYLNYNWTKEEAGKALNLAQKVADLVNVPFLAIDLALTVDNNWIVIECNDAQESGYCGVNKQSLWQNIIQLERKEKM